MTDGRLTKTLQQLDKKREALIALQQAGLLQWVSFLNDDSEIFMESDIDIDSLRRGFRKLFNCNEQLESYYINWTGKHLVIVYNYGDQRVLFFTTDVDHMLDKVSKGKCRVETATTETTEKYVVCEA